MIKGLPAGWGKCSRIVELGDIPSVLACWKDTIAVSLSIGKIAILDGITGSQSAVFSGHSQCVRSFAFSPDGTLLVSGGNDKTIKLWDVQTGGIIRTFYGHTNPVCTVSISADCAKISSGSHNRAIFLWDVHTGECYHIIEHQELVGCVAFSPIDPQCFVSASGNKIQQWDTNGCRNQQWHANGHRIQEWDITTKDSPIHTPTCVAFSSDGAQVALCQGTLEYSYNNLWRSLRVYCFSPDCRLMALSNDSGVEVWDVTGSDPHLIETFTAFVDQITSLAFSSSSSFISSSTDGSVRFWQIGAPLTNPVTLDPDPVTSITLQAKDGIVISSHAGGVGRIWDVTTGLCKMSFKVLAKTSRLAAHLAADKLTLAVWQQKEQISILKVHIGDHLETPHSETLLQAVDDFSNSSDMGISGDGSKVFCVFFKKLVAWSTETGEVVGEVGFLYACYYASLIVNGSKVWVHYRDSWSFRGWDFGVPGSRPVPLPSVAFGDIGVVMHGSRIMKDMVTGKIVFQLSRELSQEVSPNLRRWDGQYLVVGYESGELLILDFKRTLSRGL